MAAFMQNNLRPVDPTIWCACAGNFVDVPAVGSMAYYIPQGHAQAKNPSSSSEIQSQPLILCRVLGVDYLADTDTDEILAKIRLFPIQCQLNESTRSELSELTQSEFNSVVKVLTPSDANNGGGFSVPKSCADMVFPPLDFNADPPVQTVRVKDVFGAVWEFRHTYRGTPRRHLLTTGWSKFVNSKKLVAGDSVVFMKSQRSGQNFVGIRRAVKAKNVSSNCRWNYLGLTDGGEEDKSTENAVKEAVEKAMRGVGFEIVYRPKVDVCDFVVQAEKVESSILDNPWMVGTRVKLALETEDLSRMTWIQGTVSKINQGGSKNTPWKMLQVTWDDPDVVQNMMNVSPWQVECVSLPEHSEVPAAKKCKISMDVGLQPHGDGQMNPLLMNSSSYPAGVQGARPGQVCVSGVSSFIHENTHQTGSNLSVSNILPVVESVSTAVDTGNAQSSNLSADPPKDVQFLGNEITGISSFQLFGKIIHLS